MDIVKVENNTEIAVVKRDQEYWSMVKDSMRPNSLKALKSDSKVFSDWGGIIPCDQNMICNFIQDQAKEKKKASTINRFVASIKKMHDFEQIRTGTHNDPTKHPKVKLLLRSLNRGYEPTQKSALTKERISTLIEGIPKTFVGKRNKALLMVGFASGGRRRSELCNMVFENLTELEDGYLIKLTDTKTGDNTEKPILGKASTALRKWLEVSKIKSGYLFPTVKKGGVLTDKRLPDITVNRIIKSLCEETGLNPALFSAHSIRSGFVTQAGIKGINQADGMQLTGHKTAQVFNRYYRAGNVINNKAGRLL